MTMQRVLGATAMLLAGVAAGLRAQADLRAIWGSGPPDIWVVGDRPVALHWDGQAWNEVPFGVRLSGNLNALWGSGPQDLFAVGEGAMVLHYDGRAWSRMTVPTDRAFVAVAGRSATDVYALGRSSSDRDPPVLLHYDGRAWSAVALTMPFRASGLALAGPDVLVAGYQRGNGVLARLSAGRWTFSGWDGQRVTDPVLAGAAWRALSAAGSSLLLYEGELGCDREGDCEDETPAIALFSGGAWSLLPPAVSAMADTRVETAFLAADGTPVVLYDGPGFARYVGGRWVPVSPQMMQMMMQPQMPPGQPQMTPQQMQMQMMMQNPMFAGLRMMAYNMSDARGAWGFSATDFYVVTSEGRVTHVVGDQATVVYDASCGDPMMAGMNPICQMLQMQQQMLNR